MGFGVLFPSHHHKSVTDLSKSQLETSSTMFVLMMKHKPALPLPCLGGLSAWAPLPWVPQHTTGASARAQRGALESTSHQGLSSLTIRGSLCAHGQCRTVGWVKHSRWHRALGKQQLLVPNCSKQAGLKHRAPSALPHSLSGLRTSASSRLGQWMQD